MVSEILKYQTISNEEYTCHDWINSVDSTYKCCLKKSDSEYIFGWEALDSITIPITGYNANLVDDFLSKNNDRYIFGFFSYDIKDVHTRSLLNEGKTKFPDLILFAAKNVVIQNKSNQLYYGSYNDFVELEKPSHDDEFDLQMTGLTLEPNVDETTYIQHIKQIKAHIQQGDFYELNYCMEYSGDLPNIESKKLFKKLMDVTKAPFSAFVDTPVCTVLSGSPERFINRRGDVITSQPIKGTSKRGQTPEADHIIAETLVNDEKEIAENVMIVDLVRNDLSKIAKKDSVRVPELCKLYSFKTVHQLISTVQCCVKEGVSFSDILEATFPMGSMTGAPKINAIKYAAHYESFNRGVYSGAVGMIEPNGNFDFNVVIRSIVLNKVNESIHVGIGGAITIKSDPKREYEECNLKYEAIRKLLNA